jgi:AraC-like DNA-binding protein
MIASVKKTSLLPQSFLGTSISGLDPGETFPPHSHTSWELLLITQGALRTKTKQSESRGVTGSIFLRPPWMTHEEMCTSNVGLKVQVIFWKPRRDAAQLRRLPQESFDATGRVHQAMSWLYDLHQTPDLARYHLDELLDLILLECARTAQPRITNRWSNVTAYVHQHLAGPLTLDQMARIAGMSRNYFVEEFHREIGLSPMAYVRKARLDQACRVITQTNKVFSEIALETGFRDEYEFSRVFRRVMGFAPSTLRPLRTPALSSK